MNECSLSPVITASSISRSFLSGETEVFAVRDISLSVKGDEWVGIIGPSGCGKSTLLNMLGLVETPSAGSLTVAGSLATGADEKTLERLRRTALGYVFQSFNLLSTLRVIENVMLPCLLVGQSEEEAFDRAKQLLSELGLSHRLDALPTTLSGGEMQRVAIARAISHKPALVLADEPTGNLDSASGDTVLDLLSDIHAQGTPIIMVTHSESAMQRCTRVIRMKDGVFVDG